MQSFLSRYDWTFKEISEIYFTPILELIFRAAEVHRHFHTTNEVQVCALFSIKTGGCPEDCAYCPQAARYNTSIMVHPLLEKDDVVERARRAKEQGATRICLGVSWREVRDNEHFDRVLDIISAVAAMDVEVCCTLGMLNESQAQRLKDAKLYAYNHNLDSSEKFYKTIISTRTYEERLKTLNAVESVGLSVCCGGIIGMGETHDDRIALIETLATRNPHPGSVPVNFLVPIKGTPLATQEPLEIWDAIRMIATARITMPKAMVRLSAGRLERSPAEQALCFLAGANSIFSGEKLLTSPNPSFLDDQKLFEKLGLSIRPPFRDQAHVARL